MKKYLPTILIAGAIILVGGFIIKALITPDSSSTTTKTLTQEDQAALKTGGSMGNPNATVVVTEFGDYQCPACAAWHSIVRDKIIPTYQDRILFVFKNFPLSIHKNAMASSQAVEAAALQGKFWEMHNIVYDNQKDWENENDPNGKFEDYARQIGLDIDRWKSDRDSAKVKDLIKADMALGEKLNLPGTPSFLVNGVLIQTNAEGDLAKAIEKALAAQAAPTSTTPAQ